MGNKRADLELVRLNIKEGKIKVASSCVSLETHLDKCASVCVSAGQLAQNLQQVSDFIKAVLKRGIPAE